MYSVAELTVFLVHLSVEVVGLEGLTRQLETEVFMLGCLGMPDMLLVEVSDHLVKVFEAHSAHQAFDLRLLGVTSKSEEDEVGVVEVEESLGGLHCPFYFG
jgi:hypothetical protein